MTARRSVPFLLIIVLSSASACARGALATSPGPGTILRASFRGRIDLGDGLRRFEGTLAAVAPDSLRVEITGPLGGVRALLAAGDNRVLALIPGTREYIDEAATAGVYEMLLGLRLDTRALIGLIRLGDEGACPAGSCETRVPMSGEDGAPDRMLIVTRQGATLQARPEEIGAVPRGLRALELRLDDTTMTRDSPDQHDLFAPRVPEGWTRVRLESLAPGGLLLPSR